MNNLPPGEKAPEGSRGTLDTPAGDGMSNLLKFALGLMPMTPARDETPKLVVATPAGATEKHLGLTLTRAKNADVNLQLQATDDLVNWADIPFTFEVIEEISPDRDRIRLLDASPIAAAARYFLRLEVTLPDGG